MVYVSRYAIVSTAVVALLSPGMCRAADHAAMLTPYVNDDTFFAAYLNLAAVANDDASDKGALFALLPAMSDDAQTSISALKGVEQTVRALRAAGVDDVYVVGGLPDAHLRGGPLLIFHIEESGKQDSVVSILKGLATALGAAGREVPEVSTHNANMVWVGSAPTLSRYESLSTNKRDDLIGPLTRLAGEGAVVAAVFCPGPDFRRVVRELWPELPGPLAPLRGELADRWQHLEAAINIPPDARPRLALQTTDPQAAESFVELLRNLPQVAEPMTALGDRRHELKKYLQPIVDALPPQIDGTHVRIRFPTKESEIAALRALTSRATDAALESSRRNRRMNQFKQLDIAMQNYHDVNKHLPPAAICDKDGKPLLSWRVAILPYLDEGKLYQQFHLDEPWDSPHNRLLIEKMPAIYADPHPKLKALAREGKTTFQVPVGAETVFHNNEGTTFREIMDGTSKTILIVEVEPLRAAVWTQPKDWEVDLEHPRRGVEQTDRNHFIVARCDGSAHAVPVDIDEKTLRALLTRAGREVIDQP